MGFYDNVNNMSSVSNNFGGMNQGFNGQGFNGQGVNSQGFNNQGFNNQGYNNVGNNFSNNQTNQFMKQPPIPFNSNITCTYTLI